MKTIVRRNRKGRGVYATQDFLPGDVVEESHVLLFPAEEVGNKLYHYVFEWDGKTCALALGLGSLFNHSYRANAQAHYDKRRKMIQFVAAKPIWRGREICINYNGAPDCPDPVEFYEGPDE